MRRAKRIEVRRLDEVKVQLGQGRSHRTPHQRVGIVVARGLETSPEIHHTNLSSVTLVSRAGLLRVLDHRAFPRCRRDLKQIEVRGFCRPGLGESLDSEVADRLLPRSKFSDRRAARCNQFAGKGLQRDLQGKPELNGPTRLQS